MKFEEARLLRLVLRSAGSENQNIDIATDNGRAFYLVLTEEVGYRRTISNEEDYVAWQHEQMEIETFAVLPIDEQLAALRSR